MVTVNGLTAEAMAAIRDQAIVEAEVVGDDLILTHFDGSTTNVGSVRGFPGIADMALYDPLGVPKPYMLAVAPDGHGMCDAATEYNAATYPVLAGAFDTGPDCVNGPCTAGNFRLPDLRGKSLFGVHGAQTLFDALHKTGGSRDAVLVSHDHDVDVQDGGDPHVHEFNHTHGANASSGEGDQIALVNNTASVQAGPDYQAVTGYTGGTTEPSPDAITGPSSDSSHDHPVTISTEGVSGVDKNVPPFRTVNWIMRLG